MTLLDQRIYERFEINNSPFINLSEDGVCLYSEEDSIEKDDIITIAPKYISLSVASIITKDLDLGGSPIEGEIKWVKKESDSYLVAERIINDFENLLNNFGSKLRINLDLIEELISKELFDESHKISKNITTLINELKDSHHNKNIRVIKHHLMNLMQQFVYLKLNPNESEIEIVTQTITLIRSNSTKLNKIAIKIGLDSILH